MFPLSVEVVEGTEMGPVFYKINHERDGRAWMVKQRFSTLHAMKDTLHAENAALPDVPFPPKQWPLAHLWQAPCTPALPPDEMEARRSGLQAYLTALSELKESWASSTVKEVLCCTTPNAAPPAASSALAQAGPRDAASPTAVKVVSWMDQQQPKPTPAKPETAEAATPLPSLATSPPIRSGMDSSAATAGAASKASPPTVKRIKDASEKHQAGKKKRRSALVRSFDAFVSSTAASKTAASKTAAAAAAVKKSDAAKEVPDNSAPALADSAEVGSRGRSLSVSGDEAFSAAPMGSSRGSGIEAVPAAVTPAATDAGAGTAAAATAAPATSPVTQPLQVNVESDVVVAPSAVTPRTADGQVGGQREVPGEMHLSEVVADVDSAAGRQVESIAPAPTSDQSLPTTSAKAAYDAVAEGESAGDIVREREEASAVSALGLSSASEDAGNDGGAALDGSASAGTESLLTPATPAAAQKRRSSLLGRAKRSLSSKKGLDKDKDKDKDKEVPLSSLGVDSPVLPVPNAPMTPGSAAAPRTPGRLASMRDRARSLKGRFSTGGGGGSGPLSLTSAKSKGKGFFSMSTASPETDAPPPPVAPPEMETTGDPDYGMPVAFSPVSLPSPPSPPNVGTVKDNSGIFMAVGDKTERVAAPPSPGYE